MKAIELKDILEAYDQRLDKNLSLHVSALENINLKKSKKTTHTILNYRIIEVISFSFLAIYLSHFVATNWGDTHLAISGIIVNVFTLIALAGSIGQIVLLKQIDFSKPIIEIRKKIELVNSHSLLFVKLMFLSAPVWWSYAIIALDIFLGLDLYVHLDPGFVLRYLAINVLLIIPLVWAFNKLSFKNLHIKWVRITIGLFTGAKTKKALAFLNEIEKFEK